VEWFIEYSDGSQARELGEGEPRNFNTAIAAVPVKRVGFLIGDGTLAHAVDVPPGAKAFARRRYAQDVVAFDSQPPRLLVHILGWQKPDGTGRYRFIYPDGRELETDSLEPEVVRG
jgi:hypothetical protein